MGRSVLQVKGYTAEEIKSLIKSDERYTIGIRLLSVLQIAQGKPSRKVEELFHVSFKQITNWVHAFEQHGIDGLRDKPRRGRKSLLSDEQKLLLSTCVTSQSPSDYGYNSDTWTGPLILDWISTQFGIHYKRAQIYNILRDLGLTHQKTKARYPEANPREQEVFKNELKKN